MLVRARLKKRHLQNQITKDVIGRLTNRVAVALRSHPKSEQLGRNGGQAFNAQQTLLSKSEDYADADACVVLYRFSGDGPIELRKVVFSLNDSNAKMWSNIDVKSAANHHTERVIGSREVLSQRVNSFMLVSSAKQYMSERRNRLTARCKPGSGDKLEKPRSRRNIILVVAARIDREAKSASCVHAQRSVPAIKVAVVALVAVNSRVREPAIDLHTRVRALAEARDGN